MNNGELRELNGSRRIHQIAWVTRDLEKSMLSWIDNLGVGPWQVLTFTNETLDYLKVDNSEVSEPFKFLIAISCCRRGSVRHARPAHAPESKFFCVEV